MGAMAMACWHEQAERHQSWCRGRAGAAAIPCHQDLMTPLNISTGSYLTSNNQRQRRPHTGDTGRGRGRLRPRSGKRGCLQEIQCPWACNAGIAAFMS